MRVFYWHPAEQRLRLRAFLRGGRIVEGPVQRDVDGVLAETVLAAPGALDRVGVDLGPGPFDLGAPGCSGYTTPDVVVIIGLVPFGPVSFPIPWSIPATPGQLWMQAVAEFPPGTLPNGQNVGGKVTNNALEIYITNN